MWSLLAFQGIKKVPGGTFSGLFREDRGMAQDRSILALAGGFRLLLALDAGLLIMLTLADFRQNAGPGTLPFEALQRAFQRFILFHTDFRHSFPPLRSSRLTNTVFTADGDHQ